MEQVVAVVSSKSWEGQASSLAAATAKTAPDPAHVNLLSKMKEVPSNISTARIFKLPPGFVLVKPNPGSQMTSKPGEPKAGAKEPSATPNAIQTTPMNRRIIAIRTVKPPGSQPIPPSSLKRAILPLQLIKTEREDNEQEQSRSNCDIIGPTAGSVLTQPEEAATASVSSSTENPKPKPKPWCREPRPLWRGKEPIVMYSGAPPENLESKRKKNTEPPKSLPCPQKLDDMLPKSFQYHLSSFEELKNPDNFKAELRTNVSNKEDALQWLKDFEDISGTNFRVTKTFKENSTRVLFKKCFKCHQNTQRKAHVQKRESKRHVGCQARLSITIKNRTMKSSSDMLLAEFPCVLGIYHNHCHSLTTPDSRRFRRALPEVREKFADMFRAKITPALARRVHMADLKRQYGDKYADVILDGAKCPPLPWCYRLYYETLGKKVKDGKKKSTRKSTYKRKTAPQANISLPILGASTPVVLDFTSENVGRIQTHSAVNIINKPVQDEVQRSVDSLYSYEFMSKERPVRKHGLLERDDVCISRETHAGLVNNTEMVSDDANHSEVIDHDELIPQDSAGADFIEDDIFLNNTEGDDNFESQDVISDHDNVQDAEELVCDKDEQRLNIVEHETLMERFSCVIEDIKVRLQSQPEIYFPPVKKFISSFERAQVNGSDSDIVTALSEFGSNLSMVMTPSPSKPEREVTSLVGGRLQSSQLSTSLPLNKPQLLGSPKRKVLVLRMTPNKFITSQGRLRPANEVKK